MNNYVPTCLCGHGEWCGNCSSFTIPPKMTTDDVLEWIAIKSAEIAFKISKCEITPFSEKIEGHGMLNILQDLRFYILMKTNPHNREDIKRVNERDA